MVRAEVDALTMAWLALIMIDFIGLEEELSHDKLPGPP